MIPVYINNIFHFFNLNYVVKCAEGTYYDKEEEECIPCAEGTYQDVEGKLECKKCPEGTWTIGAQAENRAGCIGKDHEI